jgi:hypothetical protein
MLLLVAIISIIFFSVVALPAEIKTPSINSVTSSSTINADSNGSLREGGQQLRSMLATNTVSKSSNAGSGVDGALQTGVQDQHKPCQFVDFSVNTTIGVGIVRIQLHHEWAPLGTARFCELIRANYYQDARFFRVLKVNFLDTVPV